MSHPAREPTGLKSAPETSGLVIVDKPGGMTSHDVVARVRRLAGTRKVGHAGTLDPMATGVLVVGVEKATRLLGYLTLTEKEYAATIRLGQSTSTDDAEGEITGTVSAADVTAETLARAVAGLTGEIQQVPPAVSAIKVGGQRAYRLTRAGGYGVPDARTLEQLAARFEVLPLAQAAAAAFPRRDLNADEARRLANGGRLASIGPPAVGPTAAYAPDGTLVALVTEESGQARPLVVFA